MRRVLFAIIFLLVGISNSASAAIPGSSNFGRGCPNGGALCSPVPLAPTFYLSTLTAVLPPSIAFSRASTGWYFNSSGNLTSAASNTPRFDYALPGSSTLYGLLLEPAATNLIIYSRDLTQTSAWTATNATVALDQTGIDGSATDASSITATSTNATVCEPVTHASTCFITSAYLKRITGTGTISLSQDGGSTYTAETITGSWARYIHAQQTLTNPQVCFKVGTSGDEIAVDVVQIESSAAGNCFYTSPIVTTTTSVTRSADVAAISPTFWYKKTSGAFTMSWRQNSLGGFNGTFMTFNNSGYGIGVNNGNVQLSGNAGSVLTNGVNKGGFTYSNILYDVAFNNTLSARGAATPTTAPTSLNFVVTNPYWLQTFKYWNYALLGSQLQAQTQ